MSASVTKPVSFWAALARRFRRTPKAAVAAEERSTLTRWLDFGEMPGWRPESEVAPAGRPEFGGAPAGQAAGGLAPVQRAESPAPARWPVVSLALVAVAAALWFAFGAAPDVLVFDRAAIAGGEWWRLATGHWVHSDASHAALNIAALALIAPIVESAGRRLLLAAMLVGTLAVSAGVVWGLPELARYCGLSGVLNALFVTALAVLWQRHRAPVILLFGGALLCKLALELASGASLVVATEWPSVPAAHLAGVVGGVLSLGLAGLLRLSTSMATQDPEATPGTRLLRAPTAAPRPGPAVASDASGVLTCL